MKKQSSLMADDLARRFSSLERMRTKAESSPINTSLTAREIELVYEGLFLSAFIAFERFLEDLFVGLLLVNRGVRSSRSNVAPRVEIHSEGIAYEMLLGLSSRKYLDWMPYKRAIDLASVYFRKGRPFGDLNDAQKDHIHKCYIMRNAIAHKSRASIDAFRKSVIASAVVPHREQTPAGYLRGMFRATPPQTRYENNVAELLLIARALAR